MPNIKKRNLFDELMEDMEALAADRIGKVTLKKTEIAYKPPPVVTAADVARIRKAINVSQQVFALKMRIEAEGPSIPFNQASREVLGNNRVLGDHLVTSC